MYCSLNSITLKNMFLCFCFIFSPSCFICLYTFLVFLQDFLNRNYSLPGRQVFLVKLSTGNGQLIKDCLKLSQYDPAIFRDLNEPGWFFKWVISFGLCLTISFISWYRNNSPFILHPVIVQLNGAVSKYSCLFTQCAMVKSYATKLIHNSHFFWKNSCPFSWK